MRAFQIAAAFAAFAVAASAAPAAKSYEQLVVQAESGDPATDFTALRMAYAKSEGYDPLGKLVSPLLHDLLAISGPDSCSKEMELSQQILKIDYTLSLVHYRRADCFKEAGDAAGAQRETAIGTGLNKSIMSGGNGTTPASAIVVVTLMEEEVMLLIVGIGQKKRIRQEFTLDGHNIMLIIGVPEKPGGQRMVCFNQDAFKDSLPPKP